MDDLVLKGLAKWPGVPAVYGWLALDCRGNWLLKKEKIGNPLVVDFIGRNYEHDDRGRWFFQNGPQRVYVSLEYTPLVYRVTCSPGGAPIVRTHCGRDVHDVSGAWLDEKGALLLESDIAVGVVHDADLNDLAQSFVDSRGNALDDEELERRMPTRDAQHDDGLYLRVGDRPVRVDHIETADVARRFGFDPDPRPEENR